MFVGSKSRDLREDSDFRGRYRTMCVRTCDDYYFPISPASSIGDLKRDQQNCEAMCPGTDVQIYYQPSDDENAEAMVSSSSGEPYADLPAAFSYRKPGTTRPAGCACNPTKNFSVIAGNPPSSWKVIDTEADSQPPQEASGSVATFGADSVEQRNKARSPDATTKLPRPANAGQGRRASVPSRPRRGNTREVTWIFAENPLFFNA